jgi:hypothetical protein
MSRANPSPSYRRYQCLVDAEFREVMLGLVERFQKCDDGEKRLLLKKKIAQHNRMILKWDEMWRTLSPSW